MSRAASPMPGPCSCTLVLFDAGISSWSLCGIWNAGVGFTPLSGPHRCALLSSCALLCLLTHRHWALWAFVPPDMSALGCLRRRIFWHIGDGSPCLRVLQHVVIGLPGPLRLPTRWCCAFWAFLFCVGSSCCSRRWCSWAGLPGVGHSGIDVGAAVSSSVLGYIRRRQVAQFHVGLCPLSSVCPPPHWPHFVVVVVVWSQVYYLI